MRKRFSRWREKVEIVCRSSNVGVCSTANHSIRCQPFGRASTPCLEVPICGLVCCVGAVDDFSPTVLDFYPRVKVKGRKSTSGRNVKEVLSPKPT
jgi:hypothetical protein